MSIFIVHDTSSCIPSHFSFPKGDQLSFGSFMPSSATQERHCSAPFISECSAHRHTCNTFTFPQECSAVPRLVHVALFFLKRVIVSVLVVSVVSFPLYGSVMTLLLVIHVIICFITAAPRYCFPSNSLVNTSIEGQWPLLPLVTYVIISITGARLLSAPR